MNSDMEQFDLSEAGQRRRIAMRSALQDAMRAHHRRRHGRRRMLARVMVLALCAAPAWLMMQQSSPVRTVPENLVTGPLKTPPPATPRVEITFIHTAPDAVSRYRAAATLSRTVFIDDRSLVHLLAAMDRPAGLVRHGDDVRLTRPVTDEAVKGGGAG